MDSRRIELYAFSHYDEIRKRWVRARYRATLEDIRQQFPQHRIHGEPEIREGGPSGFVVQLPPSDSS